jgi:hypothetical protein
LPPPMRAGSNNNGNRNGNGNGQQNVGTGNGSKNGKRNTGDDNGSGAWACGTALAIPHGSSTLLGWHTYGMHSVPWVPASWGRTRHKPTARALIVVLPGNGSYNEGDDNGSNNG